MVDPDGGKLLYRLEGRLLVNDPCHVCASNMQPFLTLTGHADLDQVVARALGSIWNCRDLFLQGVMSETELALASSFSAFDVALWLEEHDDASLPLGCNRLFFVTRMRGQFCQKCVMPEASRPRALGHRPRLAGRPSVLGTCFVAGT